MITIKGRSSVPCFKCEKTEKTLDVVFKDKRFAGSLCLNCLYEKTEVKGAPSSGSGKAA
jgi:hypothetical protein